MSFRVKGLADPHLLAAGQPMAYALDDASKAQLTTDGTVTLAADPSKDETYTTRVYAPDPAPKDLANASTDTRPTSGAGSRSAAWSSRRGARRCPGR